MNEDDASPPGEPLQNPGEGAVPPENLVDLMNRLIEPPEPAPIPLAPQTWGWVALAIVFVVVLAWVAARVAAHRRANAYRRAALDALGNAETAAEIALILRRAALTAYARSDVAGLVGSQWIAFLSRSGERAFPEAVGAELSSAPYRGETPSASPQLREAAETWLRTHRRGPAPPIARRTEATEVAG